MRFALVCAIVLGGSPAIADRPDPFGEVALRAPFRPRPMPQMQCRTAPSWAKVVACLSKFQVPIEIGTVGTARLFKLPSYGLALYLQKGSRIDIGGYWPSFDENSTIQRFVPQKLGAHSGYRIDIATSFPSADALSELAPAEQSLHRTQASLYCSGVGSNCTWVMRTCEVIVAGRTVWAFHAKIDIGADNLVSIDGDRTKTHPSCRTAEKLPLDWPQK